MSLSRPRDDRDHLLWVASLVAVLAAHAGAALLLMSVTPVPHAIETPALMLDLAPLPAAPPPEEPKPDPEPPAEPAPPPPVPPVELPPPEVPPEPVIEPPPPPEPEPPPIIEPPPPLVQPVVPEVAVPPPPPVPIPKPLKPPPMPRPAPRQPTPPVTAPAPQQTAAPPAQVAPVNTAAAATWQSRLLAHLTRFKRYPPSAQMRQQQGIALLRFTMTRTGAVTSFRLERGSGYPALDQETLDLIQRAQPLPALPPEMTQETIELVVPLRFELR